MKALQYRFQDLVQQRAELTDQMAEVYYEIVEHQRQLKSLGNGSYSDYLQSPEWKARAKQARRRAGNRCQMCNAGDRVLHVHHRTYERLGNEEPRDLICLCEGCHRRFHGITEPADDKVTG